MSHRLTICTAAVTIAAIGLGCQDTRTPTTPAGDLRPTEGPRYTIGSGVTNLLLVRANAGSIKVHSEYNGFKSKLSTDDNTDIVVNNNSMIAGGHSGWHTHPGITIVAIKSGALTLYDGDDPHCQPRTYGAGHVFIEEGGNVHMARNEGSVDAIWYTTYIAPAGAATRVDAPAPGNCPF